MSHLLSLLSTICIIVSSNAQNTTTSPTMSPTSPIAFLSSIFYSTANATYSPTSPTISPTTSPTTEPTLSPTRSPTILLLDDYSYSIIICLEFSGITEEKATETPSVFSLAVEDIIGITTDIDVIVYNIMGTDAGVSLCMEIVTTNGYSYNTINTITSAADTFETALIAEIQNGYPSAAIVSYSKEDAGTKLTDDIYPEDVESFIELFFTGYLVLGAMFILLGTVWLVLLRGPYVSNMAIASGGVITNDEEIASVSGGRSGSGVQLVNTAGGKRGETVLAPAAVQVQLGNIVPVKEPVARREFTSVASTSATVASTKGDDNDSDSSIKRKQTKEMLESAWNDDEVAGPNSVQDEETLL